jgi:hypothetical protein
MGSSAHRGVRFAFSDESKGRAIPECSKMHGLTPNLARRRVRRKSELYSEKPKQGGVHGFGRWICPESQPVEINDYRDVALGTLATNNGSRVLHRQPQF